MLFSLYRLYRSMFRWHLHNATLLMFHLYFYFHRHTIVSGSVLLLLRVGLSLSILTANTLFSHQSQ